MLSVFGVYSLVILGLSTCRFHEGPYLLLRRHSSPWKAAILEPFRV